MIYRLIASPGRRLAPSVAPIKYERYLSRTCAIVPLVRRSEYASLRVDNRVRRMGSVRQPKVQMSGKRKPNYIVLNTMCRQFYNQ